MTDDDKTDNKSGAIIDPTALRRRTLLGAAAAGAGMATLGMPMIASAAKRKFRIALSNSYIGNEWRIEMENVYKAALKMEPYKSEVAGTWYNSGNNVSRESQQIAGMIAERVDAILVDAASPTGLNGILHKAHERGILVISFDNVVTTPAALKVNTDQFKFGQHGAEWLANKLGGKGNVIMVTGVPGTTVDQQRNKGAESVWNKHPGIKIVGKYPGMWDSATAEQKTASVLPSLPKIDGIWCQGGGGGVLKAFISAKRPLPPTASEATNGFRKFLLGYKGHKVEGISIGQPPYLSVISLELARRVLNKSYPAKDITIPFPIVTNATAKEGVNVFPHLPDSFYADFTDSGPNAVVEFCSDAPLKGKPCGTHLKVRLPKA